jgi:hypothetical protein
MPLSRAMATASLALVLVGCQQQGRGARVDRVCQCECVCPGQRPGSQVAAPTTAPALATVPAPRPAAPAAPLAKPAARFHIGVLTATAAQGNGGFRGAEQLVRDYGAVSADGMIQHLTYPDGGPTRRDVVLSSLVSLAGDPLMKVVVVDRAVPGVSAAFKRLKAKRPDILLLTGPPQENPATVRAAADLVVDFGKAEKAAKGGTGPADAGQASLLTAGLAEFGKSVVEAKAERTSLEDLLSSLGKYTPGVQWSGDYSADAKTHARAKNQVLVNMKSPGLEKSSSTPPKP